MRQFLFVLFLLASLPAAAKAVPYAEYDPRTGDILFSGVRGLTVITINSRRSNLRASILTETPIISPADAAAPILQPGTSTPYSGIQWMMEWPPKFNRPFEFDSLLFPAAVPPGTPTSDLWGAAWVGTTSGFQLNVVTLPEPNSVALCATGIVGAIAVRRRG